MSGWRLCTAAAGCCRGEMKGWKLVTMSGLSFAGRPHSKVVLQHKVTSKGSPGPPWAALSAKTQSKRYCTHCPVFVVWHTKEAAGQLLPLQCCTANALKQCDADRCQTAGITLCSKKGRECWGSAADCKRVGHCMVSVPCGCGLPVSSNLFLWGSGLPC